MSSVNGPVSVLEAIAEEADDKVVGPGLFDDAFFADSEDYNEEAAKAINGENGAVNAPFVNQDRSFLNLLDSLGTRYSSVVLWGSAGIGKSVMIDFFTKVMSGEVSIDEALEFYPEAGDALESLMDKAKENERRAYLFVPDMQNPNSVVPVVYTDPERLEQDTNEANKFYRGIALLLKNFVGNNEGNLRLSVKEDEFRNLVNGRIAELFSDMYDPVHEATQKQRSRRDMVRLGISVDGEKVEGSWNFVERSGKQYTEKDMARYTRVSGQRAGTVMPGGIPGWEEFLSVNVITRRVRELVDYMLEGLQQFDIIGRETEEGLPTQIFYDELSTFTERVIDPIVEEYKNGENEGLTTTAVELSTLSANLDYNARISARNVDDLLETIDQTAEDAASTVSEDLGSRMNGLATYFRNNEDLLAQKLYDLWEEMEIVLSATRERVKERLEAEARADGRRMSKTRLERGVRAEAKKALAEIEFSLDYGNELYPVEDILEVKAVGTIPQDDRGASTATLDGAKVVRENSFAEFKTKQQTPRGFGTGVERTLPPHMRLVSLGTFFNAGITVVYDRFSNFVKELDQGTEEQGSKLPAFLELFESGIWTMEHDGVSYKIPNRTMWITSDNDYPFVYIQDGAPVQVQGLDSRWTVVNVPSSVPNTLESRLGSFSVLQRAANEWNKEQAAGGRDPIEVGPDVLSYFVKKSMTPTGEVSLVYRDLSTKVQEIQGKARREGFNRLDMETMAEIERREEQRVNLERLRKQIVGPHGIAKTEGKVGVAHAVSAVGHILHVDSYAIPRPDGSGFVKFGLTERVSDLANPMSSMEYDLAIQYANRFLAENELSTELVRGSWQVVTNYSDFLADKSVAPGIGLSTAVSVMSALSGKQIAPNRFMIGKVLPDGAVEGVSNYLELDQMIQWLGRTYDILSQDEEHPIYFFVPEQDAPEIARLFDFDPLGSLDRVSVIPVSSVDQAVYLGSQPEITYSNLRAALNPKAMEESRAEVIQGIEDNPLLKDVLVEKRGPIGLTPQNGN